MNTSEEKTASRIYEIKSWLIENDKKYDVSGINEKRIKLQIELKLLENKHSEVPFIRTQKQESVENE